MAESLKALALNPEFERVDADGGGSNEVDDVGPTMSVAKVAAGRTLKNVLDLR